jgi:hypothetical protein
MFKKIGIPVCPMETATYHQQGHSNCTIKLYNGVLGANIEKLELIVKLSFTRKLVEDYFATEPISKILVGNDYQGAAILEEPISGWYYLDKFAVIHKGHSLGKTLFAEILKTCADENKGLFWRSRIDGAANEWYLKQMGQHGGSIMLWLPWVIYQIGGDKKDDEKIAAYAASKRVTLEDLPLSELDKYRISPGTEHLVSREGRER